MQNSPDAPSSLGRCSACGRVLPADAPAGNCPSCLWQLVATPPFGPDTAVEVAMRFGEYELVEELARGGMGIVWRARHVGLGREVALKTILAGRLASAAQVQRFYTEARAAARLDHPNIVPLYEIGEEDGRHFYAMKLMEGGSLADAIRRSGKLAPENAARFVAALAHAVHFAHQRGVLHRDLKPSNILLDGTGAAHVADFGLARIVDAEASVSATGVVVGTPAYMAPEQAAGTSGEITTAADVYALGAVLYEALAGTPPFRADTPLKTLRLVTETEPASLRFRDGAIARDLEVVVVKCLRKRPEQRYASAGELAADLERWLRREPILARPISKHERLVSWVRRKPELAAALGVLVGVIVVAFAVTLSLFFRVQRESERRAASLRQEEGERLAFQSLAVLDGNPGQALLLSLEAAQRAPSRSANSALLVALEANHERRRLLGHTHSVYSVRFSSDRTRVATAAHDRTARIWDAATGRTTAVLRGHERALNSCEFSSDGTLVLTASDDATARLWNAATGEPVRTFSGHTHALKTALFSPDASRVLTIGQDTARLWETASAKAIWLLDQHTSKVTCACFSPEGARVATGSADRTVKVWDVKTGACLATLDGAAGIVLDVAFSADGKRLAASGAENRARVWNASTHEAVSTLSGHLNHIYSLAITSDGAVLATGSEDFSARIWDARTGAELHKLPHDHKVIRVDISRDDSLVLTASYDRTARVWDLKTGSLVATFRGHAAPLVDAAFSPDGAVVATACVDFTARLWSVRTAEPLVLGAGDGGLAWASVAPGGKRAVLVDSDSPSARLVELPSHAEHARLEGHEGHIAMARFSPDGAKVATGSKDGTARLWEAATGRALHVLGDLGGEVRDLLFSPDGRKVLTLAGDRNLCVSYVEDGARLLRQSGKASLVGASFHPDAARVTMHNNLGDLQILDLATGAVQTWPHGRIGGVSSACYGSGDNEIFFTTSTTRVYLLDATTGQTTPTLVHPARIWTVTVSPDRRWVGTTAIDGVVRIWNRATRLEHLSVKRSGMFALRVEFAGDSERVVVTWFPLVSHTSNESDFIVYSINVHAVAEAARFGALTPDERDHFQVGSAEERSAHRAAWTEGHIYGDGSAR